MVAETFLFGFPPSRWAVVCRHTSRIWGLYCCGGGAALSKNAIKYQCLLFRLTFIQVRLKLGFKHRFPQSQAPHLHHSWETNYLWDHWNFPWNFSMPRTRCVCVCVCVCVWACVLDRETERGSHTCSLSPWNWVNSEPVNPAVASKMSLSPGASNREPPHWFVQVCVSVSRGRIEGMEVTVVRAQDRQSQTRHLNCAESILRNWVLGTQLPPSLISEDELLDMSHCSLNGIRSKGKRKKKKNRWQHTLWILQPAPPPTSLGKPWAFKAVSFFFSFFFFSFFCFISFSVVAGSSVDMCLGGKAGG